MLGFSTYAALLPQLRDEWRMSNAEAGVVSGMFFAGYIGTVSLWTALTDRVDARKVYVTGSLFAALGSAGFGFAVGGFASAVFFQVLLGVGAMVLSLAALRVPGGGRFSVHSLFPLRAWQRVLADRPSAGYTLGYMAHCLELFGSRAWMVAFLAYSASLHAGASFPWSLAAIAAVVNLLAVPASILGNEVALRIGRRRWILLVMAASGSSGLVLGWAAPWHWSLVLALLVGYSMLVMAESGTLTAGLVGAAPPELRGAAMGLYSLAGFAGGLLGPVVFGAALDIAGGAVAPQAWIAAYAAIGAGCLAAPIVARINAKTAPR